MIGLKIDEKHTYYDFGMKMLSFNVSEPEIYEEKIKVPGRNGLLDMSEALTGEPIYQNRKLQATFDLYGENAETLEDKKSSICNFMHGKAVRIVYDKDPDYYYEGRMSVKAHQKNKLYFSVELTADIQPFKLKHEKTIVSTTVSGSSKVICPNIRMSVVPEITTNADFELSFGDYVANINDAGTYMIPDIKFTEGNNEIICSGNGTIAFSYQEGSL